MTSHSCAEVSRNHLESVKTRKLTFFGHVMQRNSNSLKKEIMQGTIPEEADKKQRGSTTYSSGLDTHWTEFFRSQKTESDGDNLFMVWPSLGVSTAKGKARQFPSVLLR